MDGPLAEIRFRSNVHSGNYTKSENIKLNVFIYTDTEANFDES